MKFWDLKKWGAACWLCLVGVLLCLGCGEEQADSRPQVEEVQVDHERLQVDGRAVVERGITALGGRAALERIQNRILKGTIEVAPLDVEGTFEIVQARPNKVYMKIETQGLGTIERGSDGNVFWERRSTGPLRYLEGEDLKLHLLTAYFDETYYEQIYKNIETMGLESVEEIECYKVLLVPYQGPSIINYYAKDSGLHLKTQLRVDRGGFHMPMETFSRDYRDINDIKVAYTILEKSMGTETWRRLTELTFNTNLPEGLFSPPSEPNSPFSN